MHIGLIIYGNLETLTGGWIYDRFLVEHLREQGHTVDVISFKQHHYMRNLADNFSRRLFLRLVNPKFQLLLEDELNHPSLVYLNQRVKRRRNCPVVSIVHQVSGRQPINRFQQLFYRTIERRYFQSVDGLIVNSETTRANVASIVDQRRPVLVAYPGGDRLGCLSSDAAIESKSRQAGPLKLLFVGNLTPNKGVLQLIMGLAPLPQKSWRLTIVGSLTMDRTYVRKIRDLITRLGLKEQVDLPGPLDGRDLVNRFNGSQVFVLPFSYEGFGIACLEAMAWGLPVVGSSRGALKEFVEDGVNGVLVDPGDITTFTHRIHDLHSHRTLLARYGRAALKTFCNRPAWKDSLRKINSFLLAIADGAKNETHPGLHHKNN